MRLETGIYKSRYPEQADGWRILCEQEKTPFHLTDDPDCPVLLCEGKTPEWLETYLAEGGIAVLSGVRPEDLPFEPEPVGLASLESADLTELGAGRARIQSLVQVYGGQGAGRLCLHEKRKIKCGMHPDEYPAVLWRKVGSGGCFYTGIPFSELICALGDTLRQTPEGSDYSERVTAVDKHLLLRAMRRLLAEAFWKRNLPYVFLHYYPEDYRSAFVFRVDVDGVYGSRLERISAAAKKAGVRVSFYVNQVLCQEEGDRLGDIDGSHEIGCHAREHNLFTAEEENYFNVRDCRSWMRDLGLRVGSGFVAPRGMWNFALNRALAKEGIEYTSDFGYCVYGLPFYPYDHGRRMAVKQIPVDPFSAERAYTKAEEEGTMLSDEYVADRFCQAVRRQYELGMPIVLYSHPQYFGRLAEKTFPRLMEELAGRKIWHATMAELNNWWTLRDGTEYSACWTEDAGLLLEGTLPEGVRIKVWRGGEADAGRGI